MLTAEYSRIPQGIVAAMALHGSLDSDIAGLDRRRGGKDFGLVAGRQEDSTSYEERRQRRKLLRLLSRVGFTRWGHYCTYEDEALDWLRARADPHFPTMADYISYKQQNPLTEPGPKDRRELSVLLEPYDGVLGYPRALGRPRECR